MKNNLCKITIMGHEYAVRSSSPSEEVQLIGKMVDDRMREISSSTHTIDSLRNAILAAITLADDLWQTKKKLDVERQEFFNKEQKLLQIIEQALEQPVTPHSENCGKSNPEPTL